MKKFFLFLLTAIGVSLSANAVPSGSYKDQRGNEILITDSQNLYKLDKNGYVKLRQKICNEKSDGSFSLRLLDEHDNIVEGTIPSTRNGWWQENGEIYFNLEFSPRTFTRQ